jgi:hypothetical protein
MVRIRLPPARSLVRVQRQAGTPQRSAFDLRKGAVRMDDGPGLHPRKVKFEGSEFVKGRVKDSGTRAARPIPIRGRVAARPPAAAPEKRSARFRSPCNSRRSCQVRRSLARRTSRERLAKGGVGKPLGIDQLSNDAMDEDLVGSREAGLGAGADGLDRRRWDSGLDRERRMRVPFIARAQVTCGQADREL